MLQVRTERRERRLKALLVADVGEHIVEARDPALGTHRRRDAALHHQRTESERLEQHRLSAGVRTRDEQRAFVGMHVEVERDHAHALRQQQRMAPLTHMEALARGDELGIGAPVRERIARAPVQRIERDERLERRGDRLALRSQRLRELQQDPLALCDLLGFELAYAIPRLDRGGRLHEQRLPRLRTVVHDPAERAATLATHRDHVATVA